MDMRWGGGWYGASAVSLLRGPLSFVHVSCSSCGLHRRSCSLRLRCGRNPPSQKAQRVTPGSRVQIQFFFCDSISAETQTIYALYYGKVGGRKGG